MPKGPYDASVTYEMLDMVSHDGATWLAKRTSVGIAPSDSVSDYWFKMVGVSAADMEAFKTEILETVSEMLSAAATVSETEENEQYNAINANFANYLPLAGGTMTGALKAKSPDVGTEGVRNIKAGTADLTAGTSALETGAIYIVYE